MKSLIKKIAVFFPGVFFLAGTVLAQNGPAGVGNGNGTDGQPEIKLWLVSDSLALSNGNDVLHWTDFSGNSNDLEATSATSPIFRDNGLNGHDYLEFSKNNNRIVRNAFDMPSDATSIFMVMRTSEGGDGIVSYAVPSDDNEYLLYQSNDLNTYIDQNNIDHNLNIADGNWKIFSHQWRNTDGRLLIHLDGGEAINTTHQTGATIESGGTFAIGGEQDDVNGGYNAGQDFDGDIAEVILFGTSLNQAQRTVIENYLAQKYGLDANLPADLYTPVLPAYVADLSGMGKESDGEVGLSSAGLVATGITNFDIGDYLFAAHDGTTNAINSAPDALYSDIESAWERNWYLHKTGELDARIAFDLSEGINGDFPANVENYRLLYKANAGDSYDTIPANIKGVQNGDQIYFEVTDANLSNGYYTLGTVDETNSPLDGIEGRTWYTLISGDWDNWEVWTQDPSGMLPDNPNHYTPSTSPTGNADKVVIRSGKTISVNTNNKSNASLRVDGRIDFTTTTGHSFGEIEGGGRVLLAADNFPSGDASHFSSAGLGEGTVVYYGSNYNLAQARTFYHVVIQLDNVANTVTLLNDYTINGDLRIEEGILQVNDNSVATALNILVNGHINIANYGQFTVGQGDAFHQLILKGNLINEGQLAFTNRVAADYTNQATDGVIELITDNASANQTIQCLGTSNFYRIEIDKGLDKTYILELQASDPSYFNLFGYANQGHGNTPQLTSNTNALGLLSGTVKIGPNINIPRLNGGGNYNISESARLWVDGGFVAKNNGTAIVPYGDLQISSGSVEARIQSGITTRANGAIIVEGGTLTTNQIRTSVHGAEHIGGYSQSGGTTHILGGATNTDYYVFNLTYPGNVFNMTGGTLHIHEAHGKGGIFIASAPSNFNVTGGTVIMEIDDNHNFPITSTAPFYNVILRNTSGGNSQHILTQAVDVGATNEDMDAQPLVVLNDLTIEADAFLDHNGQDVSIGHNFYLDDNAQQQGTNNKGYLYDAGTPNNTIFNGNTGGTIYIGESTETGYELFLTNMEIDKPADSTLLLTGDPAKEAGNVSTLYFSRLLQVTDNFIHKSGIFNQGEYSVRLFGTVELHADAALGVYIPGTTQTNASIVFRGAGLTVNSEDGARIGNFKMDVNNPASDEIAFTSDVEIARIGYTDGKINIGTHNLKVDYLHENYTTNQYNISSGNAGNEMIYGAGNASDGGLTLYIPASTPDGTTIGFPVGVAGKYTPAEITLNGISDDGYITCTPVDAVLETTEQNGNIMSYYWRVKHSNFTTLPTVRLAFTYNDADLDGNNINSFRPGKVLDDYPYTRSHESNSDIDNPNNILNFDDDGSGFSLENANYTAGQNTRFNGQVYIFYTRDHGSTTGDGAREPDWRDRYTWTRSDLLTDLDGNGTIDEYEWHDSRQPEIPNNDPNGEYPDQGDIAVIGWVPWTDIQKPALQGQPHGVWISNYTQQVAELRFTPLTDAMGNPVPRVYRSNFQFRPTLCIDNTNGQLVAGLVRGEGLFWNRRSAPDFSLMDIGEFAREDSSYVVYESWANPNTISNTPPLFPNLMVATDGWGGNDKDLTFTEDIVTNGDLELLGDVNLILSSGATGDITVGGNLELFESQGTEGNASGGGALLLFQNNGTPRTLTVNGNISLVNQNAHIAINNPNAPQIEHTIKLFGDYYQDITSGTGLELWTAPDEDAVILELLGSGSSNFNLISGNIPEMYRLIMNKGTNQQAIASMNCDFNLNGTTNGASSEKALLLQHGTFELNHPDININLSTGGGDFEILSTSALVLNQGQVNVNGNSGILLDGRLELNSGAIDMTGGNNYIEYSASEKAELIINGGTLTVGSQIRRGLGSDIGSLKYTQTAGTVIIGSDAAPESNRGMFEILGAGSSFIHSGGELYLVRQQVNPTMASLYLDPESSNLAPGTTINLGHPTTPTGQNFGVNSAIPLQNLIVNNTSNNDPTATLMINPLVINEDLILQNNAELNANGINMTLLGDLINAGSFLPNGNTTYLAGSTDQSISGNTSFYKMIKSTDNTLTLQQNNAEIHVMNDMELHGGTLDDGGNSIFVNGYTNMDALHLHGSTGDGIVLQGTSQQQLTGNGTFGKLTINNANNILVPLGNEFTITDTLKMQQGVFYIGSNLLTLEENAVIEEASPFSETNMIQTNISFTDKGVRKIFPPGASTFTFPIGASGKYTPINLDISTNDNSTGHLTVKAANERHPSIQEDSEAPDPEITDSLNVLQYHWIVNADGISGFSADMDIKYKPSDVEVTAPYTVNDYITARLLNDGSGNWNKYDDVNTFDETNEELHFSFTNVTDVEIEGDYTAGVDGSTFNGAIPDNVPFYESTVTGDWTTGTVWNPSVSGGPRGAMVRINPPDTVTLPGNYISSYTTEVNGQVNVGTTFGHRFGIVNGTGTIYLESEALPAGVYEDFFASTGGTVEFSGSTDYDVLAGITVVNNITFSGTGERRLPNQDLLIRGNWDIAGLAGLIMNNEHNVAVTVLGDINLGTGSFDAGDGADASIVMQGAGSQTISGNFTGPNAFNMLEIDNSHGLQMLGNIDVSNQLILSEGVVSTNGNPLTIKHNASISPPAGTTNNYIDGALTKEMISGNYFTYPIADGTDRGEMTITGATGFTGIRDFTVNYHFDNPTDAGYDAEQTSSPIEVVSVAEYWDVQGPAGATVRFSFSLDGSSDIANSTDLTNLRIVGWNGAQWVTVGGVPSVTGSATSGTISTTAGITLDGSIQHFTLASISPVQSATATITSGDETICSGSSTSISILFTGTQPWSITYTEDGAPQTITGITDNTYELAISPATSTTYVLTAVSDDNGAGNLVGDLDAVISVTAVSALANSTDVTCYDGSDGSITIHTEAGGSGTYEYSINGGSGWHSTDEFNNLTTGTYDVRIRDANAPYCEYIINGAMNISQPTEITAGYSATDETCSGGNDGTITVTGASGGSGNFEYSVNDGVTWQTSNSFTGLAPASYDVWVRDQSTPSCSVYIAEITILAGPVITTGTIYRLPNN